MMLARMMLERAERRGIERGMEQGIEQGHAEQQQKWESWNYRRLRAQEEGREFNEPPPSLGDWDSNA